MLEEDCSHRLFDAERLKRWGAPSGRAGPTEAEIGRAVVATGIRDALDQQVVAGSEDVGRQAHDQGSVSNADGISLHGFAKKCPGSEAVQIPESDPAIHSGAPEVGRRSI